ncbi:hypothetical protein KOW79_015316 [Hemibagrus wyckioides]|uniref:Uncharacterized protein n=1 Tax=Hemibagrus wyckioides TaxID=337641 RepID=A0A9D3SDZ8_9TELE|nr:hypothetical protein KOW79_015316 [Hemibagrus wyckioides]
MLPPIHQSPQRHPLQKSPSVASGVRRKGLARSKSSAIAPDVLDAAEVHRIVRRRAPAPPTYPRIGPNKTSGIAPDVLAAKVHQIVRERAPAPPTFPRIGRVPKPAP